MRRCRDDMRVRERRGMHSRRAKPGDVRDVGQQNRFHLVANVIDHVTQVGPGAQHVKAGFWDKLIEHKKYIEDYGQDMPEIRNWQWRAQR